MGEQMYEVPSFTPAPQRKKSRVKVALVVIGAVLAACVGGSVIVAAASGGSAPSDRSVKFGSAVATALAAPPTVAVPQPIGTPQPTTAEPTADDNQTFGPGTYEVGKVSDPKAGTIKPGTFVLITGDHCYWERLSGFGGELSDIIANDNLDASGDKPAQARITIKRTDKGVSLGDGCILGQKGGLK